MNSGLEAKYFKYNNKKKKRKKKKNEHGKHKDNFSENDRRFSDSKETL